MARFGSFKRDLCSFEIPHFADENHFRRLAQRGTQGRRKVARVVSDFALIDGGSFVIVKILNRIFDGDNVVGLLLIDDVDDGGLSGALARARWTGDQY